jgi:hypothetical protein
MKNTAIAVCAVLLLAGALIAAICWHQQRQAVRAELVDADEAIRALDEYSNQQYSGGPAIDLTEADLRAREKMAALDHGYHTVAENACGAMLGFELDTVETKMKTRRAVFEGARLAAETSSSQKAANAAFAKAMSDFPAPTTSPNSCIDDLR